jgi:hypothetical protein
MAASDSKAAIQLRPAGGAHDSDPGDDDADGPEAPPSRPPASPFPIMDGDDEQGSPATPAPQSPSVARRVRARVELAGWAAAATASRAAR